MTRSPVVSAANGYLFLDVLYDRATRRAGLPVEQIAIAIRIYETTPDLCIDQGIFRPGTGLPFPTLAAWLAYCEEVFAELGCYPDGT